MLQSLIIFADELASNSSIPSLLKYTGNVFFPKDIGILYYFERRSMRSAAFPAYLGAAIWIHSATTLHTSMSIDCWVISGISGDAIAFWTWYHQQSHSARINDVRPWDPATQVGFWQVAMVMESWWTSCGLQVQAHDNTLEVAKAQKWPPPWRRSSWESCKWFELSALQLGEAHSKMVVVVQGEIFFLWWLFMESIPNQDSTKV